jgi:hypothetical protein
MMIEFEMMGNAAKRAAKASELVEDGMADRIYQRRMDATIDEDCSRTFLMCFSSRALTRD